MTQAVSPAQRAAVSLSSYVARLPILLSGMPVVPRAVLGSAAHSGCNGSSRTGRSCLGHGLPWKNAVTRVGLETVSEMPCFRRPATLSSCQALPASNIPNCQRFARERAAAERGVAVALFGIEHRWCCSHLLLRCFGLISARNHHSSGCKGCTRRHTDAAMGV